MTAKNTNPSRFDDISWNRLNDLSHTSKNRRIVAAIVHAKNASHANGPSHHARDNRTVANLVYRAIENNWNDVLLSAASSRHMTSGEYAAIINSATLYIEDVYLAILDSPAAECPALMSMLQSRTPYPAVKEAARAARVAWVRGSIEAIKANPETYGLDDGEEHTLVLRAVRAAVEMDRHDLVADLIATGCTGSFTAEYTLAA